MNALIHFAYFAFSRFVEDGVNFSINSDDPLICQTRMDFEQGVAFNQIGLSPAELTQAVSCLSRTKRVNRVKDDFQSVLRSLSTLIFINIISSHSMESESMLYVMSHIPYLCSLSNSLPTASLIFTAVKLFHQVI